jgi:hypothetical protein
MMGFTCAGKLGFCPEECSNIRSSFRLSFPQRLIIGLGRSQRSIRVGKNLKHLIEARYFEN